MNETAARLRADRESSDAFLFAKALVSAACCRICVFRDASDNTCRHSPPRPKVDGTPVWPRVGDDHWCGGFRE